MDKTFQIFCKILDPPPPYFVKYKLNCHFTDVYVIVRGHEYCDGSYIYYLYTNSMMFDLRLHSFLYYSALLFSLEYITLVIPNAIKSSSLYN